MAQAGPVANGGRFNAPLARRMPCAGGLRSCHFVAFAILLGVARCARVTQEMSTDEVIDEIAGGREVLGHACCAEGGAHSLLAASIAVDGCVCFRQCVVRGSHWGRLRFVLGGFMSRPNLATTKPACAWRPDGGPLQKSKTVRCWTYAGRAAKWLVEGPA